MKKELLAYSLTLTWVLAACAPSSGSKSSQHPSSPQTQARLQNVLLNGPTHSMFPTAGNKPSSQAAGKMDISSNGNTASDSHSTNQEDDSQNCFNAICNNTADLKSAFHKDTSVDENQYSQAAQWIDKFFTAEAEHDQKFLNAARAMKVQEIQVSPKVKDGAAILYLSMRLGENLKYAVSGENGSNQIDEAAYLKENGQNSTHLTHDMIQILNKFLNRPIMQLALAGRDWDDYLNTTVPVPPKGDVRTALSMSTANHVQAGFQEFYLMMGQTYQPSSAMQKALAGQDLSADDRNSLMGDAFTSDLMEQSLHGDYVGSFEKLHFSQTAIYKAIMGLSADQIESALNATRQLRKEQCQKNIRLSLQNSLTTAELDQLKKNIQLVKVISKQEVAEALKNPAMVQAISKMIDETDFKFPDTHNDVASAIPAYFTDLMNAEKIELNPQSLWLDYFTFGGEALRSEEQRKRVSASECNDFLPTESPTDHVMTSSGRITLSTVSGKDSRLGLGIAAHEMGHVVIYGISVTDTDYQDLEALGPTTGPLRCERDRVKNMKYLIESFADSFSAHVLKHLPDQSLATNIGCTLTSASDKDLTLVNKDTTDPHPADFLRALIFQQDMHQELPDSCRRLLQENHFGDLKSCY